MIDIQPLPTLTRRYHGEDIATFSARHAARNSLTVPEVDSWLKEQGLLRSAKPRDPARLAAWRTLGALHPSAFDTPKEVNDNRVTDRVLCRACTAGSIARGRLSGVGMVCLRHRRWLGSPSQRQLTERDILSAERLFRTVLARKGELFDSPVMQIAGEIAVLGTDPQLRLPQGSLPQEALLYPIQVRFACLLTTPTFLDSIITIPAGYASRRAIIREAVERNFPVQDQAVRWRAENRLNEIAIRLSRDVVNASWLGQDPADEWNLLRYATKTSPASAGHRQGCRPWCRRRLKTRP